MADDAMRGIVAAEKLSILVGITGHRRLDPAWAGGPGTGLYRAVRAKLAAMRQQPPKDAPANEKARSYPHSPLVLVSCLAEGTDQLALAAAQGLEWAGGRWVERDPALVDGFVVVLPLPVPLLETDFDPAYGVAFHTDSLARFRGLLKRATSVIPMHEFEDLPFGRADVSAPDHDPEIRRAYYGLAGEYLARRCHVLLAMWDGDEPEAKVQPQARLAAPIRGESTLAAMRIKAGGRPLGPPLSLGLRPQSTWPYLPDLHPIHPPEPGLVWQVNAPRPGQHRSASANETFLPFVWTHPLDVPPQPEGHGREATGRPPAHSPSHSITLPGSVVSQHESKVQAIIAELDEYNRRLTKYAPLHQTKLRSWPLAMAGQEEFAPLLTQYHNADSLALHYQDRAEEGVWFLFRLGCVAAVAFVCYAKLFEEPYKYLALGAYILAFAYAATRIQQLRWQQARRLHEACRSFAEALRVQLAWNVARVPHLVSDHYLQRYRGDVLWVRRAIDGLLLLHPPTTAALDLNSAQEVNIGWVEDQKKFLSKKVIVTAENMRDPRHKKGFGLLLHSRVTALLSCSVVLAVALALTKGGKPIWKQWNGGEVPLSTPGGGAGEFPMAHAAQEVAGAAHGLNLLQGMALFIAGLAAAWVMVRLAMAKRAELRKEAHHAPEVARLETRTLARISGVALGASALSVVLFVAMGRLPWFQEFIIHNENTSYIVWGSCIGMLITLAGLIHFVSDKMAYREHAANYEVAAAVFTRASIDVEQNLNKQPWGQEEAAEFQEQVLRLGREALAENTRWVTVQRSKPLDLPHVH